MRSQTCTDEHNPHNALGDATFFAEQKRVFCVVVVVVAPDLAVCLCAMPPHMSVAIEPMHVRIHPVALRHKDKRARVRVQTHSLVHIAWRRHQRSSTPNAHSRMLRNRISVILFWLSADVDFVVVDGDDRCRHSKTSRRCALPSLPLWRSPSKNIDCMAKADALCLSRVMLRNRLLGFARRQNRTSCIMRVCVCVRARQAIDGWPRKTYELNSTGWQRKSDSSYAF